MIERVIDLLLQHPFLRFRFPTAIMAFGGHAVLPDGRVYMRHSLYK